MTERGMSMFKRWLNKRWLNTELAKDEARRFKEFLRDSHIKYETSEAGNLIHFECLMDNLEKTRANDFLRGMKHERS